MNITNLSLPSRPVFGESSLCGAPFSESKKSRKAPSCRVLSEDFVQQLRALNALNRQLRATGIQVLVQDLQSATLTIDPNSLSLLFDHFADQLGGFLSRREGRYTRHHTRLGLINLTWLSPTPDFFIDR